MKIGMRKFSMKKRISSRTTGRLKRSVKKVSNPLYGKKGMGYINNPQKAVYNKVYNKTSFSALSLPKSGIGIFLYLFFIFPFVISYYLFKLFFLFCLFIYKQIKIRKNGKSPYLEDETSDLEHKEDLDKTEM